MSYRTDVGEGFARLLADEIAGVAWQTSGVYLGDITGIYIAVVPPLPNRIITLTVYGLGDDATLSDSTAGLQVRTRSAAQDPRDVYDLDDAIADCLLGRFPLDLPNGVHVQTLVRSSDTPLGQDDNQRWEHVSNYGLGLHRPGTHRL